MHIICFGGRRVVMTLMKRFCSSKIFVWYLVAAFSTMSFVSNAWTMFIPSPYERTGTSHRDADLQKIQKVLESKLIQEKLSQFGGTTTEIEVRLSQLDDDQIHEIANQISALEAGGNDILVFINIHSGGRCGNPHPGGNGSHRYLALVVTTSLELYYKLITKDTMDLVSGSYSGPITDAVGNVS
jgi:hypothetical protein